MIDSTFFIYTAVAVAVGMLIWDTVEVGRNDATNIVNAVFGARVMRRKNAVFLAGLAVIIGAWASSPVMETARKGIFLPETVTMSDALAIYLAVYITDTVLLYSFSAYGMPVSTTAGLVFALLGGGLMLGGFDSVDNYKSIQVLIAIVCSIFVSGIAGFLIQRAFRGAIGKDCTEIRKIKLHGPWIAGALMTGLVYFMIFKGMSGVAAVKAFKSETLDVLSNSDYIGVMIIVWGILSFITFIIMQIGGDKIRARLFPILAIIGMIAIAIAFGQNDLANAASPGLAAIMILQKGELAHHYDVPSWMLLCCGILLFLGMTTVNAQRVTRAEVNTGSQSDIVRLYAPKWCIWIAGFIVPKQKDDEVLAPKSEFTEDHKLQHYDALRASVITSVSASVIAFASGIGLPVSTTYVSFAAVVSTGWADRIFHRGDAHLKMGRTIWVITCWFLSAFLAMITTALVAKLISVLGTLGIFIALGVNLTARSFVKQKAQDQEDRMQEEAAERKKKLGENVKFASDIDSDEL